MNMNPILYWGLVAIVGWLALREIFTIVTGITQTDHVKPGQRVCHAVALGMYAASIFMGVYFRTWWPLLIGPFVVVQWRRAVRRSGQEYGENTPPNAPEEKRIRH